MLVTSKENYVQNHYVEKQLFFWSDLKFLFFSEVSVCSFWGSGSLLPVMKFCNLYSFVTYTNALFLIRYTNSVTIIYCRFNYILLMIHFYMESVDANWKPSY